MKKTIATVAGVAILATLVGLARYTYLAQSQRADDAWEPRVPHATYTSSRPRVVIDQAHYNAHTARGKYRPFARLLEADGCEVSVGRKRFSARALEGVDLLVVADHAPFGEASAALAAAFGVRTNKGFVEVPDTPSDPMVFSRENGWLGDHPILSGNGGDTAIDRVLTFTGQSLDGPPEASVLLRLPPTAVEYVPQRDGSEARMIERPAGTAQGVAIEYGAGRVVVLGEAAMLTAQILGDEKFGMNSPDCDNRQLALNIVHWLTWTL